MIFLFILTVFCDMSKIDRAVGILQKYLGRFLDQDALYGLLSLNDPDTENHEKPYKLIYYLKLRGYLIPLKRNLFLVSSPEKKRNQDQILNSFYWRILAELIKNFGPKRCYIGGLKALEISLWDLDIHEEIMLVNEKKQGTELVLLEHMAVLKNYTNKGKNLILDFVKFTDKVKIWTEVFLVAKPELAILEVLYNSSTLQRNYAEEIIKKWIKKHKRNFDFTLIESVLKLGKHNSSINRLMIILEQIDIEMSLKVKDLIKRFGYLLY